MGNVRIQFTKFEFSQQRFTKAISDEIILRMMRTGARAFRMTMNLVPVWTGESLGGLRTVPEALKDIALFTELMQRANKPNPRARKMRRWPGGPYKNAYSAFSYAEGPLRIQGNRIVFNFSNDAAGFTLADKYALKNTGPWHFSRSFTAVWKQLLAQDIAQNNTINLNKFSVRQRATINV